MVTNGESEHPMALCLLDYQVGLCDAGEHCMAPPLAEQVAHRRVVPLAARCLAEARTAEVYVVHVRLAFDDSYELRTNRTPRFDTYRENRRMLEGSPEAQFVEALRPSPHEPVVTKGCVDPFIGTPLLELLSAGGIRHLLIGGVATNLVVESAVRHAADSGFQVTVIEDICASFDPELHEMSTTRLLPMFAEVRTAEDAIGLLRSAQRHDGHEERI
jgi:biuret amidohydrolase